jgi:hypothetical protein
MCRFGVERDLLVGPIWPALGGLGSFRMLFSGCEHVFMDNIPVDCFDPR